MKTRSLACLSAALLLAAGCDTMSVGARPGGGAATEAGRPGPGAEELWFIGRLKDDLRARGLLGEEVEVPLDDVPPSGGLVTQRGESFVPVPLEHTSVDARLFGGLASVGVTQRFANPFDEKIEAVYVFPLPEDAAVSEFLMTIGERTIRGIVRERKEAEELYAEARALGLVASLMTQERPNVFTQKVANIEPGRAIDVSVEYYHDVAYADGWYELVFPMVVGPRYNPPRPADAGAQPGEGVGAVARDAAGTSGERVEVPYLAPGERSGHDIELAVRVEPGVPIRALECRTHRIEVERPDPATAVVRLADDDVIPDKDFVLRYRVSEEEPVGACLARRTGDDGGGGFFTLTVYPPDEPPVARRPLELVFVVDTSGSMKGRPLALAKGALLRSLELLQPGDSFQLVRFSEGSSQLGSRPLEVTTGNVERGERWVRRLKANGGTRMMEGIRAALDFEHDPERLRVVAFLTDGFIGNEYGILDLLAEELGPSRVFSFGVGSSPNRFLLAEMAREGRGAVAYVGLEDDPREVVELYFDRIAHPVWTDLEVEWGGLAVDEVYPARLPDLLAGRPVALTGRFLALDPEQTTVRVLAWSGGRLVARDLPLVVAGPADAPAAVAKVWARKKIAELSRGIFRDGGAGLAEATAAIRDVALEHGLLSPFTAFVAVDSLTRTAGDHGTTVPVAVPVPEGVRYETTVGGR